MPLTKIRRIGSSKVSTVSECQDELGHAVAQKKVDRRSISNFALERIFSSASLWRTFRNPGLVPYREIDPQECQIVMDLMEQSVETRICEGYGDAKTVLFVLRGILQSLAFLHQKGYAHANLKPSNVFFDSDGRIRISDGYLYSMDSPSTLPKPINQKYLTPEHTSDSFGGIGPKTDMYCAGFIALELFAGDRFGRGFQGIGDNASDSDHAWFQWHGSSLAAPDATVFYKACPPELASIIARLVAKNPADRFDSVQEALDLLPQSIQTEVKQAVASRAESSVAKTVPSASNILDRPNHGIVLAIASGPRAGEMIGTEDIEFAIGFDSDCLLQFAEEDYPSVQAKVTCQRSDQGWRLTRLRGSGVYLNQLPVDEGASLRSGDIIRLSWRGPDVQFNLQNSAFSLKSVVRRCFPESASTTGPRSAAPMPPSAVRPLPPGAPAQQLTSFGRNEPARPIAPFLPPKPAERSAPVAPASIVATPIHSALPVRGSAESAAPAKPYPPAFPTAGPSVVASKPKVKTATENPKAKVKLTKNQQNMLIAGIGSIVILIAVILVPSGETPKEKPDTPPPSLEQKDFEEQKNLEGSTTNTTNTTNTTSESNTKQETP